MGPWHVAVPIPNPVYGAFFLLPPGRVLDVLCVVSSGFGFPPAPSDCCPCIGVMRRWGAPSLVLGLTALLFTKGFSYTVLLTHFCLKWYFFQSIPEGGGLWDLQSCSALGHRSSRAAAASHCSAPSRTHRCLLNLSLFKILLIYLFLERGEGREKEMETSMCGCLLCAPHWEPGLQPRHVPWLGIELATLGFSVRCSIHWAMPARAAYSFFCGACPYPFMHKYLRNISHRPGAI